MKSGDSSSTWSTELQLAWSDRIGPVVVRYLLVSRAHPPQAVVHLTLGPRSRFSSSRLANLVSLGVPCDDEKRNRRRNQSSAHSFSYSTLNAHLMSIGGHVDNSDDVTLLCCFL